MLRIIIADDHSAIRTSLRESLTEEFVDVQIEEVPNATELVKRVKEEQFDFIISDLYMPGGGGIKAAEQIKKFNQEVPIVIMSMFPAEQYQQYALNAGALCFLSKDTLPFSLIDCIRNYFDSKSKAI